MENIFNYISDNIVFFIGFAIILVIVLAIIFNYIIAIASALALISIFISKGSLEVIVVILTFFITVVAWYTYSVAQRSYDFIKTQWRKDNLHKLREQLNRERLIYERNIDHIDLLIETILNNDEISLDEQIEQIEKIKAMRTPILDRWLNELNFLAIYILEGAVPELQAKEMFRSIYKELVRTEGTRNHIAHSVVASQDEYTLASLIRLINEWKLLGEK